MMVLFTVLSLKYQIMYNLAFSYRFQESLFYSLGKTSRRFILHVEAYFSARRSILFQLFY